MALYWQSVTVTGHCTLKVALTEHGQICQLTVTGPQNRRPQIPYEALFCGLQHDKHLLRTLSNDISRTKSDIIASTYSAFSSSCCKHDRSGFLLNQVLETSPLRRQLQAKLWQNQRRGVVIAMTQLFFLALCTCVLVLTG